MKTIYTKEIDGLTVILGLDQERIDQIATEKKIKPYLEESKEFKAKQVRLQKIKGLTIANDSLRKQARRIINRVSLSSGISANELQPKDYEASDLNSLNKYDAQYKNNINEMAAFQKGLKEINEAINKKRKQLIKKRGVYFNILENETRIEDNKAVEYKNAIKNIGAKRQFLLLDGSIIDDLRNKEFFGKPSDKWEKIKVEKLGETIDRAIYKYYEDLIDSEKLEISIQFEQDRISELSTEEKTKEKEMVIDNLAGEALNMRGKLEIQGDSEALIKSQAYYQEKLIEINKKYK
jgi:hypothetical protein